MEGDSRTEDAGLECDRESATTEARVDYGKNSDTTTERLGDDFHVGHRIAIRQRMVCDGTSDRDILVEACVGRAEMLRYFKLEDSPVVRKFQLSRSCACLRNSMLRILVRKRSFESESLSQNVAEKAQDLPTVNLM